MEIRDDEGGCGAESNLGLRSAAAGPDTRQVWGRARESPSGELELV